MGEAEGPGANWHGHVTALSIAPDYRRLGLAAKLMSGLEEIAEKYKSTIIYLTQPSPTPLNFVFQETGLLCRLVCPRLQHCRHQHVQESRLHHLPNSPWILFRFTRWRRLRYKISILKTLLSFQLIFWFFADMTKALSRDVNKESVIPLTHPVRPEDID